MLHLKNLRKRSKEAMRYRGKERTYAPLRKKAGTDVKVLKELEEPRGGGAWFAGHGGIVPGRGEAPKFDRGHSTPSASKFRDCANTDSADVCYLGTMLGASNHPQQTAFGIERHHQRKI